MSMRFQKLKDFLNEIATLWIIENSYKVDWMELIKRNIILGRTVFNFVKAPKNF